MALLGNYASVSVVIGMKCWKVPSYDSLYQSHPPGRTTAIYHNVYNTTIARPKPNPTVIPNSPNPNPQFPNPTLQRPTLQKNMPWV